MPRHATVFEREPLYAEVWAEPMRTVAARYDLSDVGLRKICTRLGVPTPPLGYWAKVAAGKAPRVTPLSHAHKGQTRYVRDIYIDEHAPERGRRVDKLLSQSTTSGSTGVALKTLLADCHVVVQRTGKRMAATAQPTL